MPRYGVYRVHVARPFTAIERLEESITLSPRQGRKQWNAHQQQSGVRLEKIDGHWTVFIVENGETFQRTFETEEFAKNFAAGQRVRFGSDEQPATT